MPDARNSGSEIHAHGEGSTTRILPTYGGDVFAKEVESALPPNASPSLASPSTVSTTSTTTMSTVEAEEAPYPYATREVPMCQSVGNYVFPKRGLTKTGVYKFVLNDPAASLVQAVRVRSEIFYHFS